MPTRVLSLSILASLLILAGCSKSEAPRAAAAGPTVATVNGKPISQSEFDLYVQTIERQSGRQLPEEQKSEVLDQYIGMHLAADAAEKQGLTKQTSVRDQLELARINVIVDAALQKYLEDNPVNDEELKPEYDKQVAAMPREYHARHILVDDKAAADTVTQELKAGADFAALAKKHSKDSSSESGGDLGWFTPDSMVKPFADAVVALKPGEITSEPVQSQFGWHVIKLEDSRASAPPPFEDVKDRVKLLVQRKKLQAYLDELRQGAKIEKNLGDVQS
ncbi:MAG: peptidylprolyl isomerase [Xanthomonadaceae bacterium]|nr:peptidylprolyl isomerase [Xanthomonadaceae bacterium]